MLGTLHEDVCAFVVVFRILLLLLFIANGCVPVGSGITIHTHTHKITHTHTQSNTQHNKVHVLHTF